MTVAEAELWIASIPCKEVYDLLDEYGQDPRDPDDGFGTQILINLGFTDPLDIAFLVGESHEKLDWC